MDLRRAIVVALTVIVFGCARPHASEISWRVLFGPILGNEMIVGHLSEGDTAWLATGGDAILRVDLNSRRHARSGIESLGAGEHIWGLAKTSSGAGLWTLVSRNALAEVNEQGQIVRRYQLDEPHVGVFAWGRDLIFQTANLRAPAFALAAGAPGGVVRRTWGRMRTREMQFNRVASAALNLVSCGSSEGALMPCWFPDTATITLTDRSGSSRDLALDGLAHVAPEILLASDNPQRPIRDAIVTNTNAIWVLGSGEPPDRRMADRPGGSLLARYDVDGRLFRRVRLPEPARILLHATEDGCVLLAWDGRVVEVRP
jgi:hypothetical protein